MNVVFYTNCQFHGLNYFLKKDIPCMNTQYISNYKLIKNNLPIPFNIIERTDIFIFQPIDKKYGVYSTDKNIKDNIMVHLPSHCKTISIPYIYNSSLWILIPPCEIDGYISNYPMMNKYINREPIEKLKIKGYSLDEVLELYFKGKIDFDYCNRFNESINILLKKEEMCDIKVAEFIRKNIKKHKLFLTQNHPTTCIYIHCVNQILSILGYNHKYNEFEYPENVCNLPLEWPQTSYDIKYWEFDYNCNIDDNWYINHIKNIYNNYRF